MAVYTCSCCKHVECWRIIGCTVYYCTAHNQYMYEGSVQCEDFELELNITIERNQSKEDANGKNKAD